MTFEKFENRMMGWIAFERMLSEGDQERLSKLGHKLEIVPNLKRFRCKRCGCIFYNPVAGFLGFYYEKDVSLSRSKSCNGESCMEMQIRDIIE